MNERALIEEEKYRQTKQAPEITHVSMGMESAATFGQRESRFCSQLKPRVVPSKANLIYGIEIIDSNWFGCCCYFCAASLQLKPLLHVHAYVGRTLDMSTKLDRRLPACLLNL